MEGIRGNREFPPAASVTMIIRKSTDEIELMAAAGRVVVETLAIVEERVRPGMTTRELDEVADRYIRSRGGVPTFKGYRGYPASICTSPNDVIVHGIPGPRPLAEGDVLSVDVGVTLEGFVADSAWTFPVGEVSAAAEALLEAGQAALAAGIEECRPGNRLSDISHAVQRATEDAGFSVVRALVGHGVGRSMHEDPQIPNFGQPGRGPALAPGMVFAIEPMITAGTYDIVLDDDEWTISTQDGSLSAHFEHTVAITDHGRRVLTAAEDRARAGLLR
jgi:methionyl aminopeptidase